MDYVLTTIFTAEMTCKIISMGLVRGRGMFVGGVWSHSYAQTAWNILDGTVVTLAMLDLVASPSTALRSLKSLRTLRVLRPLRMIARNEGLRLVVNALFRAIPAIVNVMFVVVRARRR